MFVVRESRPDDVEGILAVAKHLDSVNLPYKRDVIVEILARSAESFTASIPIVDREYTFVLEDPETGQIVGTSMLYAQHGTHKSPHVYLDVLQDEHYSETLDTYLVHQALRIGYNYNGPTEIGGLVVLPEYRGHAQQLGKLLSCTRFLFIAMNREVFRDEVLSELMPRLEEDGTSRLWKHFGKRFTGLQYREADQLSKNNKEFIKSLFPQGMVHTSLFPKAVQAEIGEVGPQTKGVEKLLTRIGFRYSYQIDPFDGGPHFAAPTDDITLVANAKRVSLVVAKEQEGTPRAGKRLVAIGRGEGHPFRCTWTTHEPGSLDMIVSREVAAALEIGEGAEAWTVSL